MAFARGPQKDVSPTRTETSDAASQSPDNNAAVGCALAHAALTRARLVLVVHAVSAGSPTTAPD